MDSEIQIRVVHVEFLRPGPPHNQLLSPLTQYLAICNNSSAGVVTVPYEHARFERKLNELRYGGGGGEDLRSVLHEVGEAVARVLGSVPGLPGALTLDSGQPGPGTLVHLRLTLSASELALLPFELAKVPINATTASEAWLAIQTRPPVCITRSVRTVSPESVDWPQRPRVLYIAASRDDVPYTQHRAALLQAIEPFRHPGKDVHLGGEGDAREEVGDLLTVLLEPTLDDVRRECWRQQSPYTHVHILAHGVLQGAEFGLALRGEEEAVDVVPGERLAKALTSVGGTGVHHPAVVTLASCDSGNVSSVMVPATHLAHALHQAGVPLVVASQFPLTKEGSPPLAASLYEGLLWGDHPLVLLHQLRGELHARYATTFHDWASLVVYEALPRSMDEQIDALQYHQARRAVDAALERVDAAVQPGYELPEGSTPGRVLKGLVDSARAAVKRLPMGGQFAVECIGLEASAAKRLAQAVNTFSLLDAAGCQELDLDPFELLEEAREHYERAVRRLLANKGRLAHRADTLHWVLVQAVSLGVILGKQKGERMEGAWEAARLAANICVEDGEVEVRGWAHGSLAELWLLRLAEKGLPEDDKQVFYANAMNHARELVRLFPNRTNFAVCSTRRQIERYLDWWGSDRFRGGLGSNGLDGRGEWKGDFGLLSAAAAMIEVLKGPQPRNGPRRTSDAGPTSGRPPGSSTSPDGAPPETPAAPPPSAPPAAATPRTLGRTRGKEAASGTFLVVEMLPAGHGDCLWIEYGRGKTRHRVLVDCGTEGTAKTLLARVERVPDDERELELFVMTHVDADHIGGALPFFKAVQRGLTIRDVWFNGWNQISGVLGPKQGEMFTTALNDLRLPLNRWQRGRAIATADGRLPRHELPGGLALTVLSPAPAQLRKMAPVWVRELKKAHLEPGERVDYGKFLKGRRPNTSTNVDELAAARFTSDTAPANGTSIALLAEYEGAAVLLGADAYAPVLADAIRRLLAERGTARLELDAFKLPHHGSQNNLSQALLELIDCPRFLVSSNGDHFFHPDPEAIARVVKFGAVGGRKPQLYFNYTSDFNEAWARPALQEKYGYSAHYPAAGESGLLLRVLGDQGPNQ